MYTTLHLIIHYIIRVSPDHRGLFHTSFPMIITCIFFLNSEVWKSGLADSGKWSMQILVGLRRRLVSRCTRQYILAHDN